MARWDGMGRIGGYGAALAMTPYLVIKISWVVGALFGLLPTGGDATLAEWVVLNGATVVMAGVGIALALALVRPWGMRIPGPPLALAAWVGAGFLVSVLPFAVVGSLLGSDDAEPDGAADGPAATDPGGDAGATLPAWEAGLIQAGFVGMGLGLALALPGYLRRRWPTAFAGRLGDGPGRSSVRWAIRSAIAAGAVPGAVWLYWAAGGTAGLAHPDRRDTAWYLLTALGAWWALAAVAAGWAVAAGRPAGTPRWVPLALGWLGSGSLFAWSGWKLPLTLYVALARPDDTVPPEHPAVAVALYGVAITAGAGLLRALVDAARPRDRPPG
ncbi:hypothetical protein [Streptomyces sp. B6B3]|uniref:hypothetical protein n=1 Tax=Streptomyces sp. B6B3 TaxID=3153570 RepID=UPI00325E153B